MTAPLTVVYEPGPAGYAKAIIGALVAALGIVGHSLTDDSFGWAVVVSALVAGLVAFAGVYFTTNAVAYTAPSTTPTPAAPPP